MRSVFIGTLLFLCLSVDAREPCDADHQEYLVRKSVEHQLREPEPDTPLVALSTEYGYVLLAEQSKFIPIADYRENGKTGLGPYDFYWWLRSRQPADLIDLNSFSGTYSHMYFHMMKLVESGEVYVRHSSRAEHLEEAHLEWYACNNERGGRRLRTESGQTIVWIPDWIA